MPLDPLSLLNLAMALTGVQMAVILLAAAVAGFLSGTVRLARDVDRELRAKDEEIERLSRRNELLEWLADRGTAQAERMRDATRPLLGKHGGDHAPRP